MNNNDNNDTVHTVMEKDYIPGENEAIDRYVSQANLTAPCIGCGRSFPVLIKVTEQEAQARIKAGSLPLLIACRDCKNKLKNYTFMQANR